jgi:hypothetical protein
LLVAKNFPFSFFTPIDLFLNPSSNRISAIFYPLTRKWSAIPTLRLPEKSIGVIKREVVVKQNQDPDFVGYIRSATGIAYPIVTNSENPFADDVALTIANGIQKSGAKVTTVTTGFNMSAEEVITKLKATGADKLILVTMDEWRSDTRSRFADVATVMIWNLSLQILDVNGNQQADNRVEGRTDGVDPSMVSSAKKIKPIIDRYYKEKMELLFGKENVLAGLKS